MTLQVIETCKYVWFSCSIVFIIFIDQLSVVSCQLSIVNCQLSIVNCHCRCHPPCPPHPPHPPYPLHPPHPPYPPPHPCPPPNTCPSLHPHPHPPCAPPPCIQAPGFPPPYPCNNTVQNELILVAIPLFIRTGTNTCLSHFSQSPESQLWEQRCSQHQ